MRSDTDINFSTEIYNANSFKILGRPRRRCDEDITGNDRRWPHYQEDEDLVFVSYTHNCENI